MFTAKKFGVSWCCDDGRLYLIWALCCGIDYTNTPISPPSTPDKAKKNKFREAFTNVGSSKAVPASTMMTASSISPPTVTGASSGATPNGGAPIATASSKAANSATPSGVGYGGGSSVIAAISKLSRSNSGLTSEEDALYESYFRALTFLLPVQGRRGRFDENTPCADRLQDIFSRSPLLVKAAELLRNGSSIEDMARRDSLYIGLLKLILRIVSHPSTAAMATNTVALYPPNEQLLHVSFHRPGARHFFEPVSQSLGRSRNKDVEQSESLAAIVCKNRDLCRGILEQAARHATDFEVGDGQKMLQICRLFTEVIVCIEPLGDDTNSTESTPSLAGRVRTTQQARSSTEKKNAEFLVWQRKNCVAEMSDGEMLRTFYFSQWAANNAMPARGRMKRLITDVNTMRTSLPEGIFVRHGSSRMDVMKVLIAGPRGTPYEGGLFEFDMFCPLDFPRKPPMMRLKTTGGGSVRFNPNLYNDGTGRSPRSTPFFA